MAIVRTGVDAGRRALDAEVVAGMCGGSGEALAELFRRYGRLVHHVATDILRDAAEAEDVAQEVFLEVFRKAGQYDAARGSVRVWLLQYAYHRALRRKDALRTRAAYGGAPLEHIRHETTDERQRLTRDECRWVLRAGLAHLPEKERRTLELACFQELPLRDIAGRMGVSVGCTRHYYYRGLAHLRAWAQRTGEPPHDCAAPQRSPRAGQLVASRQTVKLVPRETERGSRSPGSRVVPFQRRDHLDP
jgi:RNA polymerase sigma-70 factor (ECF subfamily)